MQLKHRPAPEHKQTVSPRLITSSTILHLSADELERTINQEQTENPTLEVAEQRICLFCSSPLYGSFCTLCGRFAQRDQTLSHIQEQGALYGSTDIRWEAQQTYFDIDNYGFNEADETDGFDPMARLSSGETLVEELLRQLKSLTAPADAAIAEQLVGNLNERGYLEISTGEIATHLQVPIARVEVVLSQLHTLEPSGIGARDLRECLLIQLHSIKDYNTPPPLAEIIIDQYLTQLGRNQFQEIARRLKVTEQEVRRTSHYIRSTLYPFPSQIYHQSVQIESHLGDSATYLRPDLIIRKYESGFEIELLEEKRYQFRVNSSYPETTVTTQKDIQGYIHQHRDRAKFFIDCIQRRWQTLKRVAELLVTRQAQFLEKGIRYLQPLTRAEVAHQLHLDESTVSRATANKYALLPNGSLAALADFFDANGSQSIKDILKEIIHGEDPRRRLSDDHLARILAERGIPLARRTVTKYREELGIGSSRERG